MSRQYSRWLIAALFLVLLKLGDIYIIRISSAGDTAEVQVPRLPYDFGEWRGAALAVTPKAVAPLARDAVVERTYVNAAGANVTAALIYSNKWEGLHPPEQCLVAGGWTVVRQTTVDLTYGEDRKHARGNVVTASKPPSGWLVQLYLFADAHTTTSSWIQQYAELLTRQGRAGGQASCLLLVAHQDPAGQASSQSMEIVKSFTEAFLPYVHKSLQP